MVSANILKDLNIEEKIGSENPVELKVRQSDQVYHFDMVVSGIYDTPNEKSESVIVSKAFLEETQNDERYCPGACWLWYYTAM